MRHHVLLVAVLTMWATSCAREQPDPATPATEGELRAPSADEPGLSQRSLAAATIYKGRRVQPGDFKGVVGITRGRGRLPICTGTLIAPDIVLTAAHCICDQATSNIYLGDDPHIRINGAGYYRIAAWESAMTCDVRTSKLLGHPRSGLDLALLRTEWEVSGVEPVVFASEVEMERAKWVRIVGFGAVDAAGADFPHEKREADVRVLSNACQGAWSGDSDAATFGCLPGSEIVAGSRSSPDTCRGDSGGPLLVSADGDSQDVPSGNLKLAGVTSRGVKNATTVCGDGGIYERLTPFARRWIEETIEKARNNRN